MLKQVIILRTDLNMRKGKMCAQAAHASMGVLMNELGANRFWSPPLPLEEWYVDAHHTKICVGAGSEEELLGVYQSAIDSGIPCAIVEDLGFTEFHGIPTKTAVAIGPWDSKEIDKITGKLKLL